MNLQCGSHAQADIALHFNPRYESGSVYVVHNTLQNRIWGSEERKYENPFPSGHPFNLEILVTQDTYKVIILLCNVLINYLRDISSLFGDFVCSL